MTAPLDPPIRELEPNAPDRAGTRGPELVRAPARSFLMIDGRGDPNTADEYRDAVAALFGLSHALRFELGKELGLAWRVGALEGLWWAEDMGEFTTDRRGDARRTAPDALRTIIRQPITVA